jgi:drug/metabolite transporter (DMT)-like permease
MKYAIGVIAAILSGFSCFIGQILQKKAINDVQPVKAIVTMKDLVTKPLWIAGLLMIMAFSTIFLIFAEMYIGAALIPGLVASGFIVLAIGSVKLLKEKLDIKEYIALAILIAGIICISFSRLSIEADASVFQERAFVIRITVFTAAATVLWYGLFILGKKLKKATFIALGAGFPFVLGTLWMQPFIFVVGDFFSGDFSKYTIIMLFVTTFIVAYTNIGGIIHNQKAMAEGNASIVIPIQQTPQQLAPVPVYFYVYALAAPSTSSYFLMIGGIILVTVAAFILSRRQTEMEKKFAA